MEQMRRRRPALATALAVLAVVVAMATAVWLVDRQEWRAAEDGLRSTPRAVVQTLDLVGDRPAPRSARAVAASRACARRSRPSCRRSGGRGRVWAKVASSIRGYNGYLVTDSEWRVIASDTPELVGDSRRTSHRTRSSRAPPGGGRGHHPPPAVRHPICRCQVWAPSSASAPHSVRVRLGRTCRESPGCAPRFRVHPLRTFNVVLSAGQVGAPRARCT